jgi:hypothetical protein
MTGQFYDVKTVKEMSSVVAMKKLYMMFFLKKKKLYMRDDYSICTTSPCFRHTLGFKCNWALA